jgi:hypothetical protein
VSALALAPPRSRELGGEPTLDEHIIGVWEGLAAHHLIACPLCGGEMTPFYGAHARQPDDSSAAQGDDSGRPGGEAGRRGGRVPAGGRCRDCETTLS